MLDGPGNLDEIQPRKNRQLRRRTKRLPFELPPPRQPIEERPGTELLTKSLLVLLAFIVIPVLLLFDRAINILVPSETLTSIWSVFTNIVVLLVACFVVGVFSYAFISLLKPLITFFAKSTEEYQDKKERRERSWRRYLKKINRIDRQIELGADYKVGDDGEIVLLENSDNPDTDVAMQINEDGELVPKKDQA